MGMGTAIRDSNDYEQEGRILVKRKKERRWAKGFATA